MTDCAKKIVKEGHENDGTRLGVIILNRNERTSQYKPTVKTVSLQSLQNT